MTPRQDMDNKVRTVPPSDDETQITILRRDLYDAEVEMVKRSKACSAAQATYQEANRAYHMAREALRSALGLPS